MNKKETEIVVGSTIRDLYPSLDEIQAREAEETLDCYLAVAMRIYDRIRLDPAAHAYFKALTASSARSTIPNERSDPAEKVPLSKNNYEKVFAPRVYVRKAIRGTGPSPGRCWQIAPPIHPRDLHLRSSLCN